MRGLRHDEYEVLDNALWNDRLPCDEECADEPPFTPFEEALICSMIERGLVVRRFCPHACDTSHPGLTDLGGLAMRLYQLLHAPAGLGSCA